MRSICSWRELGEERLRLFRGTRQRARLGDGCQILVGLRCGFLNGHESVAG